MHMPQNCQCQFTWLSRVIAIDVTAIDDTANAPYLHMHMPVKSTGQAGDIYYAKLMQLWVYLGSVWNDCGFLKKLFLVGL